jgi:transcriptional antiterminator NusG
MSEKDNETLDNQQEFELESDPASSEQALINAEEDSTVGETDPGEEPQVEMVTEPDEDASSSQEESAVSEDHSSTTEISDEASQNEEVVAEEEISSEGDEVAPVVDEAIEHEQEVIEESGAEELAEDTEDLTDREPPPSNGEPEDEVAVEESDSLEEASAEGEVELAQELATTPVRAEEPDDGRLWFVVHCYSGYENKVRHNLEQRIDTMGMKTKIFDVVVPTEEEIEIKNGKRRTVERRVFPGYILVQMIMDEDSWYVVRNTPGVTGFVGMGNEPTPLRPEEVGQIVKRMEADAPRIKVTYSQGQKVRIIDGPFNDFIGTVSDIDMERAKVRVMVSFFGRETPVELDFLQVEKA